MITWRGLWQSYRVRVLAALAVGALVVGGLVVSPTPVGASSGPPAELRDVVGALHDLNATLKEIAQGLDGIERVLKEQRR